MPYGVPPESWTSRSALPGASDADVEGGRVQPHVRAHDPRQEDVADLVVDGVVPIDPLLLDEATFEAELRCDGRDLAGVVRLDPADRDQRVGSLRECVGDKVLKLADLVPTEGEP